MTTTDYCHHLGKPLSLFNSEKEMQDWLSGELKDAYGLADLLIESAREPSNLPAANEEEKVIVESYTSCISSLWITEVISEDIDISISEGEMLRPDFLLFAPETEAIVVVELKNIPGPTRQAGTELGAYSAEIRSAIPFISDADIVHVVVSNDWPTLLRHYVFHQIFWQRKRVACLKPVETDDGIRLDWILPSELASGQITPNISYRHLGGFQICLYDYELMKGSDDKTRLDPFLEQMRTSLRVMSATGNSQNSHGFAFLWRDSAEFSIAPFSITTLNFAPFQTVERFLHLDLEELPFLIKKFFGIIRDHLPEGHGEAISEVANRGSEMLKHFCSPAYEGYHDWSFHKQVMDERAELISFSSWGFFQDEFTKTLISNYQGGDTDTPYDSPELGMAIVEKFIDYDYDFIEPSTVVFNDDE